jgi:hypothetical protein
VLNLENFQLQTSLGKGGFRKGFGKRLQKKEDTGISARCLPEGRKCAAYLDGVNYLFYRTDEQTVNQSHPDRFAPTSPSAGGCDFL